MCASEDSVVNHYGFTLRAQIVPRCSSLCIELSNRNRLRILAFQCSFVSVVTSGVSGSNPSTGNSVSSRIPTTWKIVIAGLIGSGTGLLILTMWSPGSKEQKFSWNETSELTPEIQLLGRMAGARIFGDGRTSIYCKNSGCSTVTCSSIPESLDPGQIASDFIIQIFQMECPSTNALEQLIFDSCIFPDNKLNRDWLNANLAIGWLTFRNCGLTELPKGSFASSIFANTKTLEIRTGKVRIWKKWTFEELANLNNLQIDDNIIHEADYDLLHSVADSLEVLMLDGCIKDVRVLSNITSGSSLSKVQIISIQRNSISTISSDIFKAIPNVVSLYLGKSEIANFEADALSATRSLLLLDLKNNLLTNLPEELFASVLNKPDFKIWMTENPWNCSCDFQWIQEMIADYPGALKEIPKCESPPRNALKYFTNAQFCDSTTITTATALSTVQATVGTTEKIIDNGTTETNPVSTDSDDKIPPLVKFTCKDSEISIMKEISRRKLFSIEEWEYPSRFRDFFAKPLTDGNVWINVRALEFSVSLIWFMSEALQSDLSGSVNCVSNVKGPLILTNLERGCSYTVCLVEVLGKAPSPFNCLAIQTHPVFQTDTWLTNEDKGIVLSISVSLLIIICIISVVSSFLVIRRNPSLLKGSKRVVMVRKRSVEALVLPEGVRMNQRELNNSSGNSCTRIKADSDYLTPVELRKWTEISSEPRRKGSKASRVSSQYSGGSYVSGIEPSPTELANWRNNARIQSYSTCLEVEESEDPPPLPPHRPAREQVIPSLSLSIESNTESPSYRACSIDANELDPAKIHFVDGIM